MEFIYLGAGIAFAFFCVFFYKRGVKDGMGLRGREEKKKTPVFLQSTAEKERLRELEAEQQQEKVMQEQFAALVNYQPEYTAVRK